MRVEHDELQGTVDITAVECHIAVDEFLGVVDCLDLAQDFVFDEGEGRDPDLVDLEVDLS